MQQFLVRFLATAGAGTLLFYFVTKREVFICPPAILFRVPVEFTVFNDEQAEQERLLSTQTTRKEKIRKLDEQLEAISNNIFGSYILLLHYTNLPYILLLHYTITLGSTHYLFAYRDAMYVFL